MRRDFLFTLMIFVFTDHAFSQTNPTDSISASLLSQNTIDLYYTAIGENAHLYNGIEYPGYNANIIGNPYFDTTVMQAGSIYHSGTLYKNILLLYDINNDAIIINKYKQNFLIRLASEKIGYFSILTDTFVRIVPDSADKALVTGIGFYNRVYNGKTEVLIKRKKLIKEDPPSNGEVKSRYVQQDQYFVKKGNVYFHISNKKSLFKLFDDKDKEIRKYLKKNNLNFKKQPEYAIVQAVKYYDLLTN